MSQSKVTSAKSAFGDLLDDLTHLRIPVTATAIAGVIVNLLPNVNISGVAVAGILSGVGVGAELINNFIWHNGKPAITTAEATTAIETVLEKVAATPAYIVEAEKEVEKITKEVETEVKKVTTRKKKAAATPVPEAPAPVKVVATVTGSGTVLPSIELDFTKATPIAKTAVKKK